MDLPASPLPHPFKHLHFGPGVLFLNMHLTTSSPRFKSENNFCSSPVQPKLLSMVFRVWGLLFGLELDGMLSSPVNRS